MALVVVDRPGPAVSEEDRWLAGLFAHLLALALERTVLRARLRDLSNEIRHLSVSANAIVKEAMTAPIVATAEYGWTGVFPVGDTHPMALSGISAADPLTRREREVADRMGRGLSNREIARELHLAPDTVKAHVARVLRKLGASNRAEAVAVYLTLTRPAAN